MKTEVTQIFYPSIDIPDCGAWEAGNGQGRIKRLASVSATAVATGSGSGWALPRCRTAEHPLPWLLPITAMLTVFGLYPLGYSIWLSLHKRNVLTRQLDFAGGYQWMRAFADQRMWGALETTLIYTLVALAAQLVLGLLIALLLDTDR